MIFFLTFDYFSYIKKPPLKSMTIRKWIGERGSNILKAFCLTFSFIIIHYCATLDL